jgi:hypothetical protein
MKKYSGQKMNIILALLAVLIVSVGYLVMQSGKEGIDETLDIGQIAASMENIASAAVNERKEKMEQMVSPVTAPMA